jgi:hypothetical protein
MRYGPRHRENGMGMLTWHPRFLVPITLRMIRKSRIALTDSKASLRQHVMGYIIATVIFLDDAHRGTIVALANLHVGIGGSTERI